MPELLLRCFRRAVLALSCGMSAAGAAAAPAAVDGIVDNTITFGMSSPMTGPTGVYGRQMKEGIEACFERVNAAGGVHGRKLRLLALDDGYEVAPAVANARRLIEQHKVFGLMAFYGTSASAAVLPLLEAADIPMVGTISGGEVLRTASNRHMFHLRASYAEETAAIVRNLVTVGVTRVAVLYQDDGFGLSGLKGIRDALAQHKLDTVSIAALPRNSGQVAAAVSAIASGKPQAVVMVTLYQPTAAFVQQMRQNGEQPYFVALSPVGADQLINELGKADARGIQVTQVIPSPWGEKLEVVREYRRALASHAKDAPLSYYGLEGFLNAKLVVAALERSGPALTRERLEVALRAAPFDLGGYRVNFAGRGNAGSSYVEVSVIGADGRVRN